MGARTTAGAFVRIAASPVHFMTLIANPLVRRTLSLMVVAAVALLTIVGVSWWLTTRTDSHAVQVVQAREVRSVMAELFSLLQDMEIGQRGFLLSRDDTYLSPYEEARQKVPATLERIRVVVGPEGAAIFAKIRELTDEKLKELSDTIKLQKSGQSNLALGIVTTGRGKVYMDELRSLLSGLIAESENLVQRRLDEMLATTSALSWTTITAGLLIFAATGATGWTVTRYTQELIAAQAKVEEANSGLEERVKERTSDLSRANEEIQRFAYIVSHDLRAPLVNILGFSSEMETSIKALQRYMNQPSDAPMEASVLADAKLAIDAEMPEALGFIRASTAKMDKLINAILKLSRQGRRELNPERVELADLIAAAAASVQHQLSEGSGEFMVQGRLPSIHADRLALEQIFGNLIDNAIKYSAPGRPTRIEVSGQERRGWIAINIADNGRGIAQEDHDRIFDLFRRAGAQDKAGEGIGLAHVRALVRRLGGDIVVKSELGRGSTFTVTLPKTYRSSIA